MVQFYKTIAVYIAGCTVGKNKHSIQHANRYNLLKHFLVLIDITKSLIDRVRIEDTGVDEESA